MYRIRRDDFSCFFQSYYLLQNPQTEGLGNSIGFGVALLFSAVFGKLELLIQTEKFLKPKWLYYLVFPPISEIGIRLAATRKAVLTGPLLASSLVAAAIFATAYSG